MAGKNIVSSTCDTKIDTLNNRYFMFRIEIEVLVNLLFLEALAGGRNVDILAEGMTIQWRCCCAIIFLRLFVHILFCKSFTEFQLSFNKMITIRNIKR